MRSSPSPSRLCSIVISTFRDHGLAPNLKRHKTSIILCISGKGATQVRRAYFSHGKAELRLDDLGECSSTNLGGMLDASAKFGPEPKYRLARASSAFESSKKLLLQNKLLPLPTRGKLYVHRTTAFGTLGRRVLAVAYRGTTSQTVGLARAGRPVLWAMIQAEHLWAAQLVKDLEWFVRGPN